MRAMVGLVVLLGCGAKSTSGEMRLYMGAKSSEPMTIHEDGTIESGSHRLRVTADGTRLTLAWPDRQNAVVVLEADGSMKPDMLGVSIAADGVATFAQGTTLAFGPDGRMIGAAAGQEVLVEGATTPELRRKAMFVTLGVSSFAVGAAMSEAAGGPQGPQMQSGTSMHAPNKQ